MEAIKDWTAQPSAALSRRAPRCQTDPFGNRLRGFVRETWHWARYKPVIFPNVDQLDDFVAALHSHPSDAISQETDEQAPVFLFATGWRAGSTLLQRILVTDARLFLWGEPLGEMNLVSGIAETVNYFLSPRNLNALRAQPSLDNLTSPWLAISWIATLSPPAGDFRSALRSLIDRWLGEPALRAGFSRWGFKEVRLGAAEASLLYWLYPKAKFVILSRHPYDCYLSLSDANWHPLYYRRPNLRVDSAAGFARHWNRLAVSWSKLPKGFPCFHVKYEDLISGNFDFRKLESWLGIEITENVALSVVVGSSAVRSRPYWYERWIIAREAASGMQALGYSE